MKTKEELEWVLKIIDETNKTSTSLNDYHKKRRREEVLEVHEMLQRPKSWEEMNYQISQSNTSLGNI